MYIDPILGTGLLASAGVLFVLMAILAAIGWVGYIKELAKNDMLTDENNRIKYKVKGYERREIIKTANECHTGWED